MNKINEALKQFNREDLIDDGHEHNDLDTGITVSLTLKQMIKYNQLQSNWNSLREWLKDNPNVALYGDGKNFVTYIELQKVLDKMNELESSDKN